MSIKLSRRDFLKFAGLGYLNLAFSPRISGTEDQESGITVRISTTSVSVFSEPSDKSKILYQLPRDSLVNVYYEITSENGPEWNPVWYRVWGGWIHSAYALKVNTILNPIIEKFPEKGQVAEVTVPYIQTFRYTQLQGWQPVYRLYTGSVHWIMGLDVGPDGEPWYRLKDELLKIEYFAPAPQLRPIPPEELSPLSPDVHPYKKWIEIILAHQTLIAYEENTEVLRSLVTSGRPDPYHLPGEPSTETPKGEFHIQNKMPSKHMGDGNVTSDPEAYELPGVPWVSFFEPITGVALHGTFWHNHFGIPGSHGCVNLPNDVAKFLYRWTTPVAPAENWVTGGYGTLVLVR
jgi:hypothetical protein